MTKNKVKQISGVTLIALVVTIIVLLILAGITISLIFSENGIIAKARLAVEKTEKGEGEEKAKLIGMSARISNYDLNPDKFISSIEENLTAEFTFDGINIITYKKNGEKYIISDDYTIMPVITVSSKEDLINIKPNNNYVLMKDIDLSGTNWTPIPTFSGIFNGNNHSINGLTINSPDDGLQALFSILNGGTIKNLALTNIDITAANADGGIAGIIQNNSVIENCFVTGKINAIRSVGGIAGYAQSNSIIKNCYTTCSITTNITGSTWTRAGGIVGSSDEGNSTITIENCYSTSEITAHSPYNGSIIGYNISKNIRNCYGLSPSISGSYIGRIFGTGTIKGQNNYGYVETLINGSTISNLDTESNNGADVNLSNLTNQEHYSTVGKWGFDENGPWTFNYTNMNVEEGTNLPILKSFITVMQNPKI